MPMLLRKSVDTNGFVCDEALSCLRQLTLNLSIPKLIAGTLVHQNAAKSSAARGKGLLVISWILLRLDDIEELVRYRDADRVIILIAKSLEDASAEVRQAARLSVQCLRDISRLPNDEASGGLSSHVTAVAQQYNKEAYAKMRQCAARPRMPVPLW